MSRRYYYGRDGFKYLDKEIELDSDGKFYSPDYGITTDTLDEMKAEIKSRAETRKRLPKQDVWVLADRYGSNEDMFVKATTTGMLDSRNDYYIWVTKQGSRKEREKVSHSSVYPQNAKNDALVEQFNELTKQRKALRAEQSKLHEKMSSITPLDENGNPVKND